jgi:hypothetical protein
MISVGLLAASVVRVLCTMDALIAQCIRSQGCPHCGGPLHASCYRRKTRGLSEDEGSPVPLQRWSWSCGRDGCRKRLTPPSVVFLGRKVYAGATIAAVQCIPERSPSDRHIRSEAGCSRQSMRRWRHAYHVVWESPLGRAIRHLFPLHPHERHHAARVLRLWPGPWPHLVARWHLIVHPITGGRHWPPRGSYEPLNAQKMDFASLLEDLQDSRFTF